MMLKQATLLSELQSIAGTKHAREPRDKRLYAVDGISPRAIVEPGTYKEVAEVLRFANTERLAIIPRGSGCHVHIGNIPSRYDIALKLGRLNEIIEHEPADLTLTCQAGVTYLALENRLAASGQLAPFQEAPDECTVGGLLASDHDEQQATQGAPRDFTIGMRVVTADGTITRAGGNVVKNVAGYDLCKLYIGSRGTLGIIVEATMKLRPLPRTKDRVEIEFDSIPRACEFVRGVQRRGACLNAVHVRRMEAVVASFDLAGTPQAVKRSVGEIQKLGHESGGRPPFQSPRTDLTIGSPPTGPILAITASVLPAKVASLAAAIEGEFGAQSGSWIDPISGNVGMAWLNAGDDELLVSRIQQVVTAAAGTLLIRVCSPELKRQIDVFGQPPPSFPLMRAIKQRFDPNNILSPGRFVGRL